MRNALGSVILGVLALLPAACAADDPPPNGARLTGRIVDDETGLPVPRDTIYIHGFSDDVKAQVSLEPEEGTDPFSLDLPTRNVRLRIPDLSKKYELWEKTFTVEGGTLDQEVRLKPTHWVLVHVKVRWRDGDKLRPLDEGDGNVKHGSISFGRGDGGYIRRMGDSDYSVRLPREMHPVRVINTNRSPNPKTLDLTNVVGEETSVEFVMEQVMK